MAKDRTASGVWAHPQLAGITPVLVVFAGVNLHA